MRVGTERIIGALAYAGGAIEPSPGRYIGNRVTVVDDEVSPLQVVVQHLVVPLGFAAIAIHGVIEALRRGELEMYGLAGERAEARGDKQQPGKQFRPVLGLAEELAGLLSEIEQDRRGIKDACLLAAGSIRIDDCRYLAVRVDRPESGRVLLALAGVDRDDLVGEAGLFKEECDLRGVGVGWK
jgi:hypothetical protein